MRTAKVSMGYRYHICDVFTDTRFGGNPLAVLPDAVGLTDRQMQQIAREFNFSESTFVFPPEAGHTRRVRIFTPATEMPFAGHPNVGTAFVLARTGAIGDSTLVRFEEKAGVVPVTIRTLEDGGVWCELAAPERLSIGRSLGVGLVASALSLSPSDVVTATHEPRVVSVGLPFVIVELRDRAALERARVNLPAFDAIKAEGIMPDIHLYVRASDGFDIRARMFAPFDGVPEDPATGSASCALAGLLAFHAPARGGTFRWRVAQGVEMGRPSVLDASAEKRDGEVTATRVGGMSVMVASGEIEVDR